VAIQFWDGDRQDALRLARLLADMEPAFREDVTLVLARRFDVEMTADIWDTGLHCGKKFRVMHICSKREGVGHPDGSYALWAGTMDALCNEYYGGRSQFDSVLTVEADGCPVAADWIDRLRSEHALAMAAGRRAIGAVVDQTTVVFERPGPDWRPGARAERSIALRGGRHVNGTLLAHLSMWSDRQSLHQTPPGHAWDLFHAPVLLQETQATPLIWNPYGTTCWSRTTLEVLGRQSAWLANCKDHSAIEWAELALTARG
jgi:hypothetical protein